MHHLRPFTLHGQASPPTVTEAPESAIDAQHVALHAEAGDDLFFDPTSRNRHARLNGVGMWVADREFVFSADVTVQLRSTFDSAILLGWRDETHWFKICVERDPAGRARIVTVVTNDYSDDSNGVYLEGGTAHLRIARMSDAYALHSSSDGRQWDLARLFRLHGDDGDGIFLGCAVQAPMGTGTEASFRDIRFSDVRLTDPRDGS